MVLMSQVSGGVTLLRIYISESELQSAGLRVKGAGAGSLIRGSTVLCTRSLYQRYTEARMIMQRIGIAKQLPLQVQSELA